MDAGPQPDLGLHASDLTVIRYRKRSLEMYPMLEQELDTLLAGYRSVHLAFFGIALGALITVAVTYYSVTLAPDAHGRFFEALLISAGFSCYFGVMAFRDWLRSLELMKRLRKETVDAVIKAAE